MPMTEKNSAAKTVFAIGVMLMIAVTCFFSLYTLLPNAAVYLGLAEPKDALPVVEVPLKKEYPFREGDDIRKEPAAPAEKFTAVVTELEDHINEYSTNENPLAPFFYKIFGTVNRTLGKNLTENSERDVYRLESGRMVYLSKSEPVYSAWDYISDFSEWLKKKDTDFLYILPISLSDDSVHDFPDGFETGYADTAEKFRDFLSKKGIDCLDAKKYLLSKNPEFDSWFYKTDHHWNVDAGIAVAGETLRLMSDKYGLNVDPAVCGRDNFESVVYKDAFLGSFGRKVTLGYTEPEDIEILCPKSDTNFHIEIRENKIDKSGSFCDTLIYEDIIRCSYSTNSSYEAFLYGDKNLIRIENKGVDNGVRVLVLKQSNADIVNPYIALAVQYTDIIDPRSFKGSIRTFIEKENPDIVLICSGCPGSEDTPWILK